MVAIKATKLNLPTCSTSITSLLYEPNSHSLALTHSDSSISLYPSLSLSSPTLLSPPISSSTFLLLPNNRPIFLLSSPTHSASRTLLRLFAPSRHSFRRLNNIICNQNKHFHYDQNLGGVVVNFRHGVSVRLCGSVSYFVLYSEFRMWVFAVKEEEEDCERVKLMRCAVIVCCKLVWSVRVSSFGVLVIGEEGGVRVVDLRSLVKGKGKGGKVRGKYVRLVDCGGGLTEVSGNREGCDDDGSGGRLENGADGCFGEGVERIDVSANLNPFKCIKGSCEGGYYFVPFRQKKNKSSETGKVASVQAISIQQLSPQRFLVLDSVGQVHILCLSDHMIKPETTCHMKPLLAAMEVRHVAATHDSSMSRERQTLWISDGCNSVHMLGLSDLDTAPDENNMRHSEKLTHISVNQAIFTAEKILDIVPLAKDSILVLGQESLYAYSIS